MRMKYKTHKGERNVELVDFICLALETGKDLDVDDVLREANAYSAQSCLARLIEILCEKKVLDAADVVDIAAHVNCTPEDEELIATEEHNKYREIQPIKTSFKIEITN